MTAAEENAAAALKASAAINQGQQHLTDESRVLLAGLLRNEMRAAVSEGLEAVLTNEDVWARVYVVLQKQATERTGRWVLSGLMEIVKKAAWVGAFVLIAYSIGGWTLVKAVWTAITKG